MVKSDLPWAKNLLNTPVVLLDPQPAIYANQTAYSADKKIRHSCYLGRKNRLRSYCHN